MDDINVDDLLDGAMNEIEYVVREVGRRGFEDSEEEADCYARLRLRKEFKELIAGEIYETYFLPERHEFDWMIVYEIVELMTSPKTIEFLKQSALPVVGGFASKAVYDVLKATLKRTIAAMRKESLPESRQQPYEQIVSDIERLHEYFESTESARIADIESATDIPRERLLPFLKLMGFDHCRRKHNCLWRRPGSENSLDSPALH